MLLQYVTLHAGYPLVPDLLALLYSPVPCGQCFPWGHCCSSGLAHTVGSPIFSAPHAASTSNAPSPSSVAAAAVACEGFPNAGYVTFRSSQWGYLASGRRGSGPFLLLRHKIGILYRCPRRYQWDTLYHSCSNLAVRSCTNPWWEQCRWLPGERLTMVRSKHEQQWISSGGDRGLEGLSLHLSS